MVTGGAGLADNSPPVNNSDSPGSSGNSRPVSMKTMIKNPGSTAGNEYAVGAQPSGRGCPACVTGSPDVPTYRAITHRPTSSAAVLRYWVIGRQEWNVSCLSQRPRPTRRDAWSGQTKLVRFPAINCTLLGNRQRRDQRFPLTPAVRNHPVPNCGAESARPGVKDMVTGCGRLGGVHPRYRAKYPVNVALHTDHCPADKLTAVRPYMISAQREQGGNFVPVACGTARQCQSMRTRYQPRSCSRRRRPTKIILRSRSASNGGEEDGAANEINGESCTPARGLREAATKTN